MGSIIIRRCLHVSALLCLLLFFFQIQGLAQASLNEDDSDFQTLVHRADSLSQKGLYGQALQAYEQALAIEPDSSRIYNPLTKKYAFLGMFDRVQARTRELYFKNEGPSNQNRLYLEGTCLMGVYEALQGHYDMALNFNVIHLVYLNQDGKYPPNCAYRIHMLAGQLDEAKAQLDQLMHVSAKTAGAGAYQAIYTIWAVYVERKLGNTERANRLMKQVEQIKLAIESGDIEYPDKAMLKYGLGLIAVLEGDKKRAVAELRKAYEMGNKQYYWWKNFNPILDFLEGYPAYEELMAEMKADVDQMRKQYLNSL